MANMDSVPKTKPSGIGDAATDPGSGVVGRRLHAPGRARGGVALPVLCGGTAARGADVTGNAAVAGAGCRSAGTRLPGAAMSRTNRPMREGRGRCRGLIGRGCCARRLAAALPGTVATDRTRPQSRPSPREHPWCRTAWTLIGKVMCHNLRQQTGAHNKPPIVIASQVV